MPTAEEFATAPPANVAGSGEAESIVLCQSRCSVCDQRPTSAQLARLKVLRFLTSSRCYVPSEAGRLLQAAGTAARCRHRKQRGYSYQAQGRNLRQVVVRALAYEPGHLTLLRTGTKMALAREFFAFASLVDRRMRRAVSAVSDGKQGRPQVLCGVWTNACPHVSAVCLAGPAGVNTTKPNREEHAMTSTLLSRRDVLKGTVALAAAASVGVATTTRWRRAEAQENAALRGLALTACSARRSMPDARRRRWRRPTRVGSTKVRRHAPSR